MRYVADRGFQALVENAPDAIVVSRDGIVLYANAAAATLLAYDSAEELIGKPMTFLDAKSLDVMRRRIQQMASTGERLVPREYPARRRDGTEITAEIASTIIEFDGAPAVLAYARDVTERTRLRAQLAHTDRLASLGIMAAGVAHEINNPLTFAGLAAEMLQRRVPAEQTRLVSDVREGLERIASIVRDLRFFGRYEDESPGPMDLSSAIDAAERLVSHEIKPRGSFIKDYGELPAVLGISRRIEQVFVNIFLNAAHALDERRDGRITLSAKVTAEHVTIFVVDDGRGIAPDKVASIFEPFFTMRGERGGTGLGLSICRDIVVRAGGDIVARSTQGEGTTMEVKLLRALRDVAPVKASSPTSVREAEPPALPLRARVLVVDDEPLIVSSLVSVLSRRANVVGETNAKRALEQMLSSAPAFDAIVCDVTMPGMNGIDIHEHIVRERPDLAARFVFVTGGAFTTHAREYLDRVPNARLSKPFAVEDLVAAVDRVVKEHH